MQMQKNRRSYQPPKIQSVEFLVENGMQLSATAKETLSLMYDDEPGAGESYVESSNSGENFFGGTGHFGSGTESYEGSTWQW